MAIDIREIELTEEQKHRIAELAEQTGRPWQDVLNDQFDDLPNTDSSERPGTYKNLYIRDRQKRMAFFREFIAQLKSRNPNFDDSRESIYFGDG